ELVALRAVAQERAGALFALAAGIHVGGVEEIAPQLHRLLHQRTTRRFVQHPRTPPGIAVGHHTQADARYLEPGAAEVDVVHDASPFSYAAGDDRRSSLRLRGPPL